MTEAKPKAEQDRVQEIEEGNLKLKAAIEERKKLEAEFSEIKTRTIMGGESLQAPAPVKVEETPKEYAARIMAGKK